MNLFLGKFIPEYQHNNCPLWDIDTDYYLHHKNVSEGVSIVNPVGNWYCYPLQQFEISQFPCNYMCSRDLTTLYTVENSLLGSIPQDILLLKSNKEIIPKCPFCSTESNGNLFCPECFCIILPLQHAILPSQIYTSKSDQYEYLNENEKLVLFDDFFDKDYVKFIEPPISFLLYILILFSLIFYK